MATIRRLSDEDVKAVFDCVHNNRPPPADLPFHLVNVGPNGLKLSPPSYEFGDGLYILLRPIKKKGKKDKDAPVKAIDPLNHPSIPSNLVAQVMTEYPTGTCPWSLSGPQFPQPTAIQQRYCYPKGDPEYSSRKGGALWTMYLDNGKEDLEYRLLHVYFSAKRAVNKGIEVPEELSSPKRYSSPKKKKQKKSAAKKKGGRHRDPDVMPALGSPGTAADSAESSVGSSPLSFQVPPPSSSKDPAYSTQSYGSGSKFITPEKDGGLSEAFQPVHLVDDLRRYPGGSTSHGMHVRHPQIRPKHSTQHQYQYAVGYSPGVSKGGRPPLPMGSRSYPTQELRTPSRNPHQYQTSPQSSYDPFPLEGDTNLFDMDSSSWPFSPAGKQQSTPAHGHPTPEARDAKNTSSQDHIQAFSVKLDSIHESIKDTIKQADESNQGMMVYTLCGWAKKVAQAPMGAIAVGGAAASSSGVANNDGNSNGNGNSNAYAYSPSAPYNYPDHQQHQSPHHHYHQHQASWAYTPNPYGQYYHQSPPNHTSPMADGSSEMDVEADQKAAV